MMTNDEMDAEFLAMTAFQATYKRSKNARKVRTIDAFFARNHSAAVRYASRVVENETDGLGIILTVEPTEDPRD